MVTLVAPLPAVHSSVCTVGGVVSFMLPGAVLSICVRIEALKSMSSSTTNSSSPSSDVGFEVEAGAWESDSSLDSLSSLSLPVKTRLSVLDGVLIRLASRSLSMS
jgi:hypothetical protein